jgi:hypothetical protein
MTFPRKIRSNGGLEGISVFPRRTRWVGQSANRDTIVFYAAFGVFSMVAFSVFSGVIATASDI